MFCCEHPIERQTCWNSACLLQDKLGQDHLYGSLLQFLIPVAIVFWSFVTESVSGCVSVSVCVCVCVVHLYELQSGSVVIMVYNE